MPKEGTRWFLALVSASAMSLMLRRLALQMPGLVDAIGTVVSSVVVLSVVGALKEGAATKGLPGQLVGALVGWWTCLGLAALAIVTAFMPVMTVRCDEDGKLRLERVRGQDAAILECRAGATQVTSVWGWAPEVSAIDAADSRRAHRTLWPFAANEVRFPTELSNPLQVLVTLDLGSLASLSSDVPRVGVLPRGCDVKQSLFCLDVEGIGEFPLGRRPLLIGGKTASTEVLAVWRAMFTAGPTSPQNPYPIAPGQELQPGEVMRMNLKKYNSRSNQFQPCRKVDDRTPVRSEANVWQIEAEELCTS